MSLLQIEFCIHAPFLNPCVLYINVSIPVKPKNCKSSNVSSLRCTNTPTPDCIKFSHFSQPAIDKLRTENWLPLASLRMTLDYTARVHGHALTAFLLYLQQLETRRWDNEVSILFLCANAATVKEKADLSRSSGQVVVQQSDLAWTS